MMTRRILLTVVVVMAAAVQALTGQTLYKPHLHVGGHAGMTLSQQSFNPSIEQKMLQGITMGTSVTWAEERHVGLRAEVNLTQRGWQEDFTDTPEFSYTHRLTYIEVPLMTHIFFGSRRVKGFFNLGPQLCYMIGDNVDANFDYHDIKSIPGFPTVNRTTEQMSMEVTNRFDYGICGGAGMELTIKRKHCISLEARYYYGLGNIFSSSKKDYFNASRGSAIMVTLGYQFRLK
ncbi:MAG: PorT family protein [Muribaculaceae bacterium]|nr:PorT family protein [Muribaculaceae bacterium]